MEVESKWEVKIICVGETLQIKIHKNKKQKLLKIKELLYWLLIYTLSQSTWFLKIFYVVQDLGKIPSKRSLLREFSNMGDIIKN